MTMNKITSFVKGLFSYKVSTTVAILLFVGVAAALALAPQKSASTKAEGCAIYTQAVFNPFPVSSLAAQPPLIPDPITIASNVRSFTLSIFKLAMIIP